jgi:hypothetical protein
MFNVGYISGYYLSKDIGVRGYFWKGNISGNLDFCDSENIRTSQRHCIFHNKGWLVTAEWENNPHLPWKSN